MVVAVPPGKVSVIGVTVSMNLEAHSSNISYVSSRSSVPTNSLVDLISPLSDIGSNSTIESLVNLI